MKKIINYCGMLLGDCACITGYSIVMGAVLRFLSKRFGNESKAYTIGGSIIAILYLMLCILHLIFLPVLKFFEKREADRRDEENDWND